MSDITFYEYAAIAAMQAMIQARATLPEDDDMSFISANTIGVSGTVALGDGNGGYYTWSRLLAEEAFEIADAMLAARKRSFS